jgi:L-lactate dehydrogenase
VLSRNDLIGTVFPAVVDENGIETVVPIELNEKELSELQQSATVLKKVIAEFYPD